MKRNEMKPNEMKYNETKRKMKKRNETKYVKQSIKVPKTINEGVKINKILSGQFGYLYNKLQIYAWMLFCCKIQKGQQKSCINTVNIVNIY